MIDKQYYYGGGETYKLDLVHILGKDNYDFTFSTPDGGLFSERIRKMGFGYIPYTPHSRIDITGFINYARMLKKHKFNVIITTDSDSWYSGIFIKFICRPTLLLAVIHISTLQSGGFFSPFKKKIISAVDRFWTRFYNTIICSTKFHADTMIEEGVSSEKVLIVHNAVDQDDITKNISSERQNGFREQLQIPENKLIISMFGRFGPGKDFTNFIKAIPLIISDYSDCVFLLVGIRMGKFIDNIGNPVF